MYIVKFCTLDDLPIIETIIDSKNSLSKKIMSEKTKKDIKDYFKEKLKIDDPTRKIVGIYDDQLNLIGFLSMSLWSSYPAWSLDYLFRDNSKKKYFTNTELMKLNLFAQEYAEQFGKFEQYIVFNSKTVFVMKNLCSMVTKRRYIPLIEDFYKKGEEFRYMSHDALFGYIKKAPYDCYITKYVLKNEYREEIINRLRKEI